MLTDSDPLLKFLTQPLASSWKCLIHLLYWRTLCPNNPSPGHQVAAAQISIALQDLPLKVLSCVIDTGTKSAAPPQTAPSVSRSPCTSGRGNLGHRALLPGQCCTGNHCWFLSPSTSSPSSLCTRRFVSVSGWWGECHLLVI